MPVMLVVFDQDGMPLDVKGLRLFDAEAIAAVGATIWSVSGEVGELLGARVSRMSLRAGSVEVELRFGAEAGYALVIDEAIAALMEAAGEEEDEAEGEDTLPVALGE